MTTDSPTFVDPHPTFTRLMDRAYDRFKANSTWSKRDFWAQLSTAERAAVFLGNMNYQVGNGGWMQWWDNGYGTQETVDALNGYLRDVGTESALTARVILNEAWSLMHDYDDSDEWDHEGTYRALDPLCARYYDLDDQLLADIEAWLVRTFKVD